MTKLLGISGSLRKGSFNTALLHTAATLLPADTMLDIRTLHGIPLYDADIETGSGIPDAVTALKDAFAAADGVLLATPEYNNSIPGVFKNGIDWLSRPPADSKRVFADKRIALLGASPGGFGTILSQAAWLPVLRTLGTNPWFGGRLMVSSAGKVFDERGMMIDAAISSQLQKFLQGFVQFVRQA
jgi:chromate reductase, NAD(P)H dehydrogenase (quinone)